MSFIRLCLQRPVTVAVGVLLVVLFGVLALFSIPVQLTPTVDVPVIQVETRWAGASPQEVEQEIVNRQEEMLRSVQGLRRMTSTSKHNSGEIKLEFYPDVDKNIALRDVNDKLRQVRDYPLEVDQPTVKAVNNSVDSPIAWLILYPQRPDVHVREMRDFVEDFVQPYLDNVEGVASTSIYGGFEREVQVRIDAGRLAARGITLAQVRDALRRQNINISAGTRAQGKRDYTVRTLGQYTDLEQVRSTVVTYDAGGPVYVHDIARVEQTFKKPSSLVRSKGQAVVAIPVRREVGTNVMAVMADLRTAVQRVNREVLEARGIGAELRQVYDETVYIDQAIAMVRNNIFIGGALAIVVLMLFLRNWRATVVVALSIPIAVIGTFVMLFAFGRTMNVVSLAGMSLAVGMVVDNAVVVLENIYRHRQMGKGTVQAALDGAHEVWGAVLASTLTTIAVFIPVIFMREEAGQLFRDISIATTFAVALSLIVAVTVIPTISARLLGRKRVTADHLQRAEGAGWLATRIAQLVARINRSTVSRVALILILTGGTLGTVGLLVPDTTYLPAGNRNLIFGFLLTPPGYNIDEFGRMADVIEQTVAPYWLAAPGSPEKHKLDEQWRAYARARLESGSIEQLHAEGLTRLQRDRIEREWLTPPPLIENFFFVSFNGGCFMGASSRDPQRVKPLKRLLERAGGQIPGVYPIFFQTQLFSFGGGNNAEIQIRGDDLSKVSAAAEALMGALSQRYGHPNPSPANFNLGRPEVQIVPNRERAADLGLTVQDIGLVVEACVDGAYVGDFELAGGDTIDIALYVEGEQDRPPQALADVPLYTPVGQIVPLSAAADLVETTGPEQINHIDRQRAVSLTVTPPETMALQTVIRQITEQMEPSLRQAGAIDPGVIVSMTGNADKLAAARAAMVGAWAGWTLQSLVNILSSRFFLSVLIVYLLMAALFESWLYPLVIMFSVPLAVFGGFLGLRLAYWGTLLTTAQPVVQLDVITFLGFVILVGLVVNNAILLVHQSLHHLREQGMPPQQAISEAVRVRVRPVFMTSLTTFFGQLPLAVMPGAGSELYRGLASVMLGGMLIATIGTLVLVPAVLSLVFELRLRLSPRSAERGATPEPGVIARDR